VCPKFQEIVRQSLELKIAPETKERFFGPYQFQDSLPEEDRDAKKSTCDFRREFLPRFPRMRNVLGELVYLAEGPNQQKQFVEVK
jgi:hypothetical protein